MSTIEGFLTSPSLDGFNSTSWLFLLNITSYPLVMTNIAMEAMTHRNRWFTHSKWWFSMAMLVITRWYNLSKCLGEIDLIASRGQKAGWSVLGPYLQSLVAEIHGTGRMINRLTYGILWQICLPITKVHLTYLESMEVCEIKNSFHNVSQLTLMTCLCVRK